MNGGGGMGGYGGGYGGYGGRQMSPYGGQGGMFGSPYGQSRGMPYMQQRPPMAPQTKPGMMPMGGGMPMGEPGAGAPPSTGLPMAPEYSKGQDPYGLTTGGNPMGQGMDGAPMGLPMAPEKPDPMMGGGMPMGDAAPMDQGMGTPSGLGGPQWMTPPSVGGASLRGGGGMPAQPTPMGSESVMSKPYIVQEPSFGQPVMSNPYTRQAPSFGAPQWQPSFGGNQPIPFMGQQPQSTGGINTQAPQQFGAPLGRPGGQKPPPGLPRPTGQPASMPPRPTGPMQPGQANWNFGPAHGGSAYNGQPFGWQPAFAPGANEYVVRSLSNPSGSGQNSWVNQINWSDALNSIGQLSGNRFNPSQWSY